MSGFASVLNKAKAKKAFTKSREKKRTPIPAGTYQTKLSAFESDVSDKKVPYVKFTFVISRGEHKGRQLVIYNQIKEFEGTIGSGPRKGEKFEITTEDCLDQIIRVIQALGIETDGADPDDLEEEIYELIESEATVWVKAKDDPKSDFPKVSVFKVEEAEDDEEDEEDEVEVEDDEDEPEEDEDDDEDDEEDEDDVEDEDEEPWTPTKGDEVQYKVRGKLHTCTVKTVNRSKETCTLERESDSKQFKNVSWDDVIA